MDQLVKVKPNTPGPNNLSGRYGYIIDIKTNDFGVTNIKVIFQDFSAWINPDFLELRSSIG